MSEDHQAILTRILDEAWNQGNIDVVDELVATEYAYHDPQYPESEGVEGYKQRVSTYRSAFPDIHFTVEDMIAEGDKLAFRWSSTGTQTGDLPDIPATNRTTSVWGIGIVRIVNGKIVEEWVVWDTLGMMQNLGVAPTPVEN